MASRHELGPTKDHLSQSLLFWARCVDGTRRQMVGVSMCVHMIALGGGGEPLSSLPLTPRSPSTDGDLSQCTNKGLHC